MDGLHRYCLLYTSIPKRSTNVSGIEDKVLSMYAKGMSQSDIAATIEEDVYKRQIQR